MKASRRARLPLEPLLHAYTSNGLLSTQGLCELPHLGRRFQTILGAHATILDENWLAQAIDAAFQREIATFYEGCVESPLHAERLPRRARVIRHALGHLRHARDPLPQRLDSCLRADGSWWIAGLGPSFWSALAVGLDPLRHASWTPDVVSGARRLGLLDVSPHERPGTIYAALLDAGRRIRALIPEMTALHCEHFLTLAARMEGRQLFSGAPRDFAALLKEVRARESLRGRLKERGQALADARELLELGLGQQDGKCLGRALFVADPEGSASTPLDWGAHGELLTLWIGRWWEADDPWPLLADFWRADPLPGAGLWLPAAVLHLRDPQSYPPWNDACRAGFATLDDSADVGPSSERYALYCEGVAWLRQRHGVHPLETSAVLAACVADAAPPGASFGGFCADTFRFLGELEQHNARAWMETQRARYQFVLREPLAELCQAVAQRYVEPVLRGQHGFDLETEARDGLALTRLTRNDYGRSRPYNTAFWIAFCQRDADGKRSPLQFFVRADGAGLHFGLKLGAATMAGRRELSRRLLAQADGLFEVLRQRGALDDGPRDLESFRAWLSGKEPTLERTLAPDAPLLGKDELAGEVLLTFDRLLPLYAAAVSAAPAFAAPTVCGYAEEDFRRDTFLDDDWLKRARSLLHLKKQLILQGVPGTGKTHVARCLARLLTGDDAEAVCLAQLHPAYSYEEFVEGIRVKSVETNGRHDVTYPVEDGLLCGFAARAAARPTQPHVLVLDEINRANLPRVFGELLYLLEYRDQDVTLPYSRRSFRLPPNLYLLGTMNASDRSTAPLDRALRRRFSFLEMPPDANVLRAWLQQHPPCGGPAFAVEVIGLFERVNAELRREVGSACQVGHSFLMLTHLDETRLRAIWQHQIRPWLEECAALHPGRAVPLDLDELRQSKRQRRLAETTT